MRVLLVVGALLLLVPLAGATASGIHLAWIGDHDAVTFTSDANTPSVTADGAPITPKPTSVTGTWTAQLPPGTTGYAVEGRTFTLTPRPTDTIRVAFVADMGTGADTDAIVAAIAREKPDVLIVGGDLSYADGAADAWQSWLDAMEPVAAYVPMMTALGNHETWCDASGNSFCGSEVRTYDALLPMPNAPRQYYAFDAGPARFVALDTEAYHATPSLTTTSARDQDAFLSQSLKSDAWKIVFFHRPLYSTNLHDDGADPEAQHDLVPLLEAGGADLVLYGHAHAYERSWPLHGGYVVTQKSAITRGQGVFYTDSGGGGRPLYSDFGPEAPWAAKRVATHEFVLLTITKDTLSAQAILPDGSVLDAFSVAKPPVNPTPTTTQASTTPNSASHPGTPQEASSPPRNAPGVEIALALVVLASVAILRRLRP